MENILITENLGKELGSPLVFPAGAADVLFSSRKQFPELEIIESHKNPEDDNLSNEGTCVYFPKPEAFGLINAELLSFLKRKGLDSITDINCVI